MRKWFFKYDVTLSFAGENRAFAEAVAGFLRKEHLRIYYDKYEQIDSWGERLYVHLDDVYGSKARYCVMFISEDYKRKVWTQYERERAQVRAFSDNRSYILPFRFDSTEITGMDDIAYLTRDEYDEEKLAAAIIEKVKRSDRLYGFRKAHDFLIRRSRAIAVTLAGGILAFSFADRLTPVDVLANRIHERSRCRPIICKDGTKSYASHRQGACSRHNGIDHVSDTVDYTKTPEECRQEAAAISWWPQ